MRFFRDSKTEFYEGLIDAMYDVLFDYARLRVSDASRAQDIVQDVCLIAWEKIDDVAESSNPKGWMMNTLKNRIRKHYERTAFEQRKTEPLTDNMPEAAPPFDSPDIASSFSSVLNPQEMRIIELKLQGYKHREIADTLGIRPGTVDSAVSRIKAKIAKLPED